MKHSYYTAEVLARNIWRVFTTRNTAQECKEYLIKNAPHALAEGRVRICFITTETIDWENI